MKKIGGWEIKLIYMATLALGMAWCHSALATGNAAGPRARPAPRTTAECMDQWRSIMTDPRPDKQGNGLPPAKMCQYSKELPADQGKCVVIYQAVLDAYTDAEKSVKELCLLVPKAYAARCDGQGNCLQATAAFQKEYAAALEKHNRNVDSLIAKMDEMAKLGLDNSEKFANDLKELKGSIDMTVSTETSRRHGGNTIAEALRNHSGQDAETVLQILQRARETSTISQDEIEHSIKSPYVFETLQASAVALDQKRDLAAYAESLKAQRAAAAQLAASGTKNGAGMNSVGSGDLAGLSLPSSLPSIPMASANGGAGGDLSIPSAAAYPASGHSSDSYEVNPTKAGGLGNRLGGNTYGKALAQGDSAGSKTGRGADGALVAASSASEPDSTAASSPNGSAASKPGPSLREMLKARMAARRAGGGAGESSGASASSGGRSSYAIGPDGRPLIGGAELDPSDPNAGRMPPMAMKNSETEGAVKAMVSDFEQSIGGANRSPASVNEEGSEILSRDTPSLFLRLREVHVRCLKRGCVGATQEKGKI